MLKKFVRGNKIVIYYDFFFIKKNVYFYLVYLEFEF